jgi:DNA helicase HerA-like ATPase
MFISGGTGSGKSETLKHLIRSYVLDDPDNAIIIFDPHGKLATEVAAMRDTSEPI